MIAEYLQLQMVFQVILLSTDRWAQKDVNPALFSRELMRNSSSFLKDEEVNGDPQILLMKAHAATSSIGSATVIIAVLEKTGTLKIASVGDCGLKVIRKGQVMFSICPQEHYFDCPYQISSEAAGQTYQDALQKHWQSLQENIQWMSHLIHPTQWRPGVGVLTSHGGRSFLERN